MRFTVNKQIIKSEIFIVEADSQDEAISNLLTGKVTDEPESTSTVVHANVSHYGCDQEDSSS
jgi:hypothetical protein